MDAEDDDLDTPQARERHRQEAAAHAARIAERRAPDPEEISR